MATIFLNLQAKGGAGKSMLTYLQALKNQANTNTAFVDLDNSTRTSFHQLKFLDEETKELTALRKKIDDLKREKEMAEQEPDSEFIVKALRTKIGNLEYQVSKDAGTARLYQLDINDSLKRIDREKFFSIVEALSKMNFEEVYIDFGAPESEQFPHLFLNDFTPEEFKEFENSIGTNIIFNCVVAGGAAYQACFEYLDNLVKKMSRFFQIRVYANQFFFFNETVQLDFLRKYCKDNNLQLIEFGAFNTQQNSGQAIIENIKAGKGLADITGFAAKTILKRNLALLN